MAFFTKKVLAGTPTVRKVSCDDVTADEFHSLRPYPGSPCLVSISNYATFCGDSITFTDSIKQYYNPFTDDCTAPDPKGRVTCKYSIPRTIDNININLDNATLPIMGNTEEVINYDDNADDPAYTNDAYKVNNYVGWYLNGVINRKEYPDKNNVEYPMTTNLPIVNYSGPLNKLLPQVIQQAQRTETIKEGTRPKASVTRHDQIVVCGRSDLGEFKPFVIPPLIKLALKNIFSKIGYDMDPAIKTFGDLINLVPNWAWNIVSTPLETLGFGEKVPINCKKGGFLSGVKPYRLSDWKGLLSLMNTVWDLLGYAGLQLADVFHKVFPWVPMDEIEAALNAQENLFAWDSRIPPFPWNTNPATGEPFDNLGYAKAYNEWRGRSCLILPLTKILICMDTFFTQNSYSDLFPYVPLSSTEDATGSAQIATTISSTADVEISDVVVTNLKSPILYFAHMLETDSLASQLQNTYLYKGADGSADGNSVPVQVGGSCSIVDVRSNKGDSLLATPITGSLAYTATFTCDFQKRPPPNDKLCHYCDNGVCLKSPHNSCIPEDECSPTVPCPPETPPPDQFCTQTIPVTLAITSKTPLVDDIWTKLVSGSSSVFRRMFPKLGADSQLGEVKDIPASTKVTYTGTVNGNDIPEQVGQLNFPHIGGISEYFLKGIQTALRPKGFGEQISFGKGSGNSQCNYDGSIDAAIANASSKYDVPSSLLRAIYEIEGTENILDPTDFLCYENEAHAAGVMQITKSTYNVVTCEDERIQDDLTECKTDPKQFSRCSPSDSFELAARVLLWKAGKWIYGPGNCSQTGGISEGNKMEIYNASCKYYGSFAPDVLTIHAASYIPPGSRRQGGDMNYCDIVCYKMGQCPPYP